MHLILSWWERNIFNNTYYISKGEINIMRIAYGDYISYSSRFWARCLGHNTNTDPRIGKLAYITPIQGHVLKNDKNVL